MNCDLNITEELQTAQMVLSVPTFVLGLMGNVAVLGMFCCRRGQSWTYMMVYITNMALADCTVLFSLPFKIYSYRNEWPFSTDFCLVLVSVYYVNIACFHRVDTPEENATRIVCFQKRKKEPLPIPFILVLELLGYALPLITMSFCSVQVIRALSKQTSASSQMDKKIQCIRIMAANWVVFVVCFTPIHFGFLLKYIVESHTEDCGLLRGVHSFMHFSFVIANMNCCLDAFSYYFATRDSWKRLSTCCQSKAGISQNAII
ncbi:G-protein coupled receptor 55-like isoform X2 [Conger conger]|uniref:G-protein coupled receptor 55-like isoform X2 n=1 Tax=Conger conger TaxID=82655 RepID=UPI002A5A6BB7|nr:G-protein coupled receptor 55-like isoform X2 [Conger conger]